VSRRALVTSPVVVAMAERRIAALVLPRPVPSGRARGPSARSAPLPLVQLLPRPRTGTLRYGMAQVSATGVVSNRSTIQALGWRCGDALHVVVVGGSVVVHRSAGGAFRMAAKPYLVLPSAVRRRCGLRPGEQVLLAADPDLDVLVVHPLAALDSMILAFHTGLAGGEDGEHPAS
jgi:hypothetical protein